MNNTHIKISNLSKIFKNNNGIKEINLDIIQGSFHAIIGSNGAGKTTLLRTILGFYQKYSGSIKIKGIDVKDKKAYKNIGYINETPIFPGELNVKSFLLWSAKLANVNMNEAKVKIDKLSKELGLSNFLKNNPNKLSSGQKQKVMLIKILIENADLIIMDEPTANLDPAARISFFDEIEKLNEEGKTIIISTHNLEEVDKKVSRFSVMDEGKVVYDSEKGEASLTEVFKKYVLGEENE